ncbi:MAG: CopG family transcriptional regulator [Actinomycetota bacterium]
MRTTLNVDDDVLFAAKERARREKRTTGEVLSELARQALTGRKGPEAAGGEGIFGFSPLPHRGPAVSNLLIDQLREEDPG